MPYTLNWDSIACQLYLNTTGRKRIQATGLSGIVINGWGNTELLLRKLCVLTPSLHRAPRALGKIWLRATHLLLQLHVWCPNTSARPHTCKAPPKEGHPCPISSYGVNFPEPCSQRNENNSRGGKSIKRVHIESFHVCKILENVNYFILLERRTLWLGEKGGTDFKRWEKLCKGWKCSGSWLLG